MGSLTATQADGNHSFCMLGQATVFHTRLLALNMSLYRGYNGIMEKKIKWKLVYDIRVI